MVGGKQITFITSEQVTNPAQLLTEDDVHKELPYPCRNRKVAFTVSRKRNWIPKKISTCKSDKRYQKEFKKSKNLNTNKKKISKNTIKIFSIHISQEFREEDNGDYFIYLFTRSRYIVSKNIH